MYPHPLSDFAQILAPLTTPWWVAGGWAVDAHLGRQTREHADVDVLVLVRDLPAVARALPAAEAQRPETGELIAWDRETPLRPGQEGLTMPVDPDLGFSTLQLLLARSEDDHWVYHRGNGSLRLPLDAITRRTQEGIPYLAPTVVLLFKSRQLREKDTADFLVLRPSLEQEERALLQRWIVSWDQSHPWLAHL
jgi:hypothetical protein